MHYSYAITSPKDTSSEEEGADANGADRDGAEQEGGCWIRLPWLELGLTTFNGSVIYGTHDGKMVERGKRNGKMV